MESVLLIVVIGILVMFSVIFGLSKVLSNGDTKVKKQSTQKENVNLIKDEYTRPNKTTPTSVSRVNYSKRTVRMEKKVKTHNTPQTSNNFSNRNSLRENNNNDIGINPFLYAEMDEHINTKTNTNDYETCHRDESARHPFESDNSHSYFGGSSSTSDCSSSSGYGGSSSSSYESGSSSSSYSSSSSSYESGSSSSSYSSSSSSYDSGSSSSSSDSSSSSFD